MNSKKYILVFTIMLLVLLSLNAQILSSAPAPRTRSETTSTDENYFKVFGGWVGSWGTNKSNRYYSNVDIDFSSSAYGGISYTYTYTNFMKLEPGVRYIDKSTKIKYNRWNYKDSVSISLVDPFLKIKVYNNLIPIEPYLGYSGALAVRENANDIKPNFLSSLLFGIDYVLPLQLLPNKIIIGMEYCLGLTEYKIKNDAKISQNSIILSTGLLF